jgi:hypothetical protein
MGAGSNDRAIDFLWDAYKVGDISLTWLDMIPVFKPLRNYKRFKELVAMIHIGFSE